LIKQIKTNINTGLKNMAEWVKLASHYPHSFQPNFEIKNNLPEKWS